VEKSGLTSTRADGWEIQPAGTQKKPSVIRRSLGVFRMAGDRPAEPGTGADVDRQD